VVEEDLGVRRAADRHALTVERERLAGAPAARADDQRAALRRDVADVDRAQLAGLLVDHVCRRGDVVARLTRTDERPALLAAVRALRDDASTFGAEAGA